MAEQNESYILSEDALNEIERLFDQHQKSRVNRGRERTLVVPGADTDIFIALPPCGECIPARVNDIPGYAECCIFQLQALPSDPNGPPAFNPERRVDIIRLGIGDLVRREIVYNMWTVPACYGRHAYLLVERDSYGHLQCLRPEKTALDSPATTTTASGAINTNSAGVVFGVHCTGQCKHEWDNEARRWNEVSNTCETTTSTTGTGTTSSTSSTSSTTTSTCPCLPTTTTSSTTTGTGTTSSTSSTSSTTTTTGCECYPPNFCGTEECEIVYTPCSTGGAIDAPDCGSTTSTTSSSSTTTTSRDCNGTCEWTCYDNAWNLESGSECPDGCDCPEPELVDGMCEEESTEQTECSETTTTTLDPCDTTTTSCGTGCRFYCSPLFGWAEIDNNCFDPCFCDSSALPDCNNDCTYATVPCVSPSTTSSSTNTTQPVTCSGQCWYVCISDGNGSTGWHYAHEVGCNFLISPTEACECRPPTNIPCTECDRQATPCVRVGTSSTTTTSPDPCASSTSSSSSTSTTSCDNGHCKWRREEGSASGEWSNVEDTCTEACPCSDTEPNTPGEECEVMMFPCPPPTTSTTGTSSSTTTSTGTTTPTSSSSTTTTLACNGTVQLVWEENWDGNGTNRWAQTSETCNGECPDGYMCALDCEGVIPGSDNGETGFTNCGCVPVPGNSNGCEFSGTTTTTQTPTSSSTTTSACEASVGNCAWVYNGATWDLTDDQCAPAMCDPPAGGGSVGECQQTPCNP